jgi:hypothetical protein
VCAEPTPNPDGEVPDLPDLPHREGFPVRHGGALLPVKDVAGLWARLDELAAYLADVRAIELDRESWVVADTLRGRASEVASRAADEERAQAANVVREAEGASDLTPPPASLPQIRTAVSALRGETFPVLRKLHERAQWYRHAADVVADDTNALLYFSLRAEPRRTSSTIRRAAAQRGAEMAPGPGGQDRHMLFGDEYKNVAGFFDEVKLSDEEVRCLLRAVWVHGNLQRALSPAEELADDVAASSRTIDTAYEHLRAADRHFAASVEQVAARSQAEEQASRERLQGRLALGGTLLLVPALVAAIYGANVGPFTGPKVGAESRVTLEGLLLLMIASATLAGTVVHVALVRVPAARGRRSEGLGSWGAVVMAVAFGSAGAILGAGDRTELWLAGGMLAVAGGLLLAMHVATLRGRGARDAVVDTSA